MRHEDARLRVSLALDRELAPPEAEELDRHLATCPECASYLRTLERLRRELRYEALEEVPDVTGRVLEAVGERRALAPALRRLVPVAAAFVAGLLLGAILGGLPFRPAPELVAADLPEQVLSAQGDVSSLIATLSVTERGWHPDVPVRTYRGRFLYRAPESVGVFLSDQTLYPSDAWVPNHVSWMVDADIWWQAGPAPCPREALPACTPPEPRVRAMADREPFSEAAPVPLDLVVPAGSFLPVTEPEPLGTRSIGGRRSVGVEVTAAQVRSLLGGLLGAGNWREVHPADRVELWLDEEALVPLEVWVYAAEGPGRELWATRHGYRDDPEIPILEARVEDVVLGEALADDAFPPPPAGAEVRRAGFRDLPWEAVDGPEPAELPDGFAPHRAGELEGSGVAVRTWSDGRSWLKVRATRGWEGARLFGDLGPAVREADLGEAGVVYVGAGGTRVALHGEGIDLEVSGSLPEAVLLRVVGSLGVEGRPVPTGWAEASTVSLSEAAAALPGLLAPAELEGFGSPAVRLEGDTVTLSYVGPGARAFRLTQNPGEALSPPLDDDVRGVALRGTSARYTPVRGELEWAEGGLVVSLRSDTLSLAELVGVAERLEPAG